MWVASSGGSPDKGMKRDFDACMLALTLVDKHIYSVAVAFLHPY